MRVLVIGGTGFMGPLVVARLVSQGDTVALIHRGQTSAPLPAGVREILADRERLADLTTEIRRLAPDVVLDMIPTTEAQARTVVACCRGAVGRLVAVSSQDVYRAYGRARRKEPGPPDPVPLTEESPLREKLYPYRGVPGALDDYDKILVEGVVLGEQHLPGTVLRLPMVYGPRDEQHRLYPYLNRMDDGRPAILLPESLGRWRWSRGYAGNMAEAIVLAVHQPQAAGRIYNVAEPEALTMAEWVRAIARAAGWHGEVVTAPPKLLPPALQSGLDTAQDLVVDSGRLRHELGYQESVAPGEALRETVAWERANPPAQVPTFDYAAEDAVLTAMGWRPGPEGAADHG